MLEVALERPRAAVAVGSCAWDVGYMLSDASASKLEVRGRMAASKKAGKARDAAEGA